MSLKGAPGAVMMRVFERNPQLFLRTMVEFGTDAVVVGGLEPCNDRYRAKVLRMLAVATDVATAQPGHAGAWAGYIDDACIAIEVEVILSFDRYRYILQQKRKTSTATGISSYSKNEKDI